MTVTAKLLHIKSRKALYVNARGVVCAIAFKKKHTQVSVGDYFGLDRTTARNVAYNFINNNKLTDEFKELYIKACNHFGVEISITDKKIVSSPVVKKPLYEKPKTEYSNKNHWS